jgi:hypothetical protein
VSDSNVPLTSRIQSWLRARHAKNEQWSREVQARDVDGVRRMAGLSGAELIAADVSIPSARNQMEMQRRLKVAIEALTAETVLGRKVATWLAVIIAALTAALVALTVVLAVRS